jgi:hypothetical protein
MGPKKTATQVQAIINAPPNAIVALAENGYALRLKGRSTKRHETVAIKTLSTNRDIFPTILGSPKLREKTYVGQCQRYSE